MQQYKYCMNQTVKITKQRRTRNIKWKNKMLFHDKSCTSRRVHWVIFQHQLPRFASSAKIN